jgi:hypothetical protein
MIEERGYGGAWRLAEDSEEKGFNTEVTEGGTQRGTERKRTDYVSAARRKDNAEALRFAEKKGRGNLRGRAETESVGGNFKSNSSAARELESCGENAKAPATVRASCRYIGRCEHLELRLGKRFLTEEDANEFT